MNSSVNGHESKSATAIDTTNKSGNACACGPDCKCGPTCKCQPGATCTLACNCAA
jgi:hypothetical protein